MNKLINLVGFSQKFAWHLAALALAFGWVQSQLDKANSWINKDGNRSAEDNLKWYMYSLNIQFTILLLQFQAFHISSVIACSKKNFNPITPFGKGGKGQAEKKKMPLKFLRTRYSLLPPSLFISYISIMGVKGHKLWPWIPSKIKLKNIIMWDFDGFVIICVIIYQLFI